MDKKELMQDLDVVVHVDRLHLDKECIRLPSDFLKFSHLAADHRAHVDELKTELDVIKAEVGELIRLHPEDFKLEKATENAIKEALVTNKRVKEAKTRLRAAEYELELVQAVVGALEMKKRSLTLMVELHGMSYFGSVKPSHEAAEAIRNQPRRGLTREEVTGRKRSERD